MIECLSGKIICLSGVGKKIHAMCDYKGFVISLPISMNKNRSPHNCQQIGDETLKFW